MTIKLEHLSSPIIIYAWTVNFGFGTGKRLFKGTYLGRIWKKHPYQRDFLKSRKHTQTIKRKAIIKLKSFKQLDMITGMQLSMSH